MSKKKQHPQKVIDEVLHRLTKGESGATVGKSLGLSKSAVNCIKARHGPKALTKRPYRPGLDPKPEIRI